MKKNYLIMLLSLVFLAVSSFFISTSFGFTPGEIPKAKELGVQKSPIDDATGILMIIGYITEAIYYIFFAVAFILTIVVAFNYLTAGDNSEQIKTAHKQLAYIAIAIAVALIAVGAHEIVYNFIEK